MLPVSRIKFRTAWAQILSSRSIWAAAFGMVLTLSVPVFLWHTYGPRAQAVIPHYAFDLSEGHKTEWVPYGGAWSIASGLVQSGRTDSRGAKIMAGSGSWADYTLQSDIRFKDERGDMGLILHSHDEDVRIELLSAILVIAFALQLSLYKMREWQSDTIMRERERLAHDIHDTMARSFAGLGYHIQVFDRSSFALR